MNIVFFIFAGIVASADPSARQLPVSVLGPYATALSFVHLETLGQVSDLSETQLRLRAKLTAKDLAGLKSILKGHKLNLFGQEFADLGVGAELGTFLARHKIRTHEELKKWKPYTFLHITKPGRELTSEELDRLKMNLQYQGDQEDLRTLVDVRAELLCGDGLKDKVRVINSDSPRPPNSSTR